MAQPGVVDRDPRDAGTPLRIGLVPGQSVGVDLLEGERHGDEPAVELGDRDLGGRVKRGDAVVGSFPFRTTRRERQPLEYGDVQSTQSLDVPCLVITAGTDGEIGRASWRESDVI